MGKDTSSFKIILTPEDVLYLFSNAQEEDQQNELVVVLLAVTKASTHGQSRGNATRRSG